MTLLASALLVGATACKDDVTPAPTPAAISSVGASTFTSLVGEVQTVRVVVTDASSRPMANQTVTFNVVDGGGTIAPASTVTSSTGEATATWTLGSVTGLQRAQAQVTGVASAVTFIATTFPGAPSTLAVSAGDNQTAPAGSTLATSPAVIVKDRFGNAVPNVSVFFTVTGGNGSVNSSGATTNAAGIATVTGWRLGTTAGANRLTALALVNGVTGNPVVFTATGTPGSASSLTALSATTQTGNVGTTVSALPSVRLVDAGGNPVAGASVTFQGSAGSSVTGAIKLTDSNGIATVDTWLLGITAGNYTLTASSGGVTPVVFTATARTGSAASVAINAGNGQSATTGRAVAIEPSVRVTDGFGNPVQGIEVLFEVTSGGGVAVARRPVTNSNGVAEVGSWTLGDVVGLNTLRATVQAGNAIIANNPILFTATATPGVPASVSIVAGNAQSANIGFAVAVPPSVVVRDNRGNPISGVTVNFLVASGGGAVTGSAPITDGSGVAQVGSWVLGNTAGAQTLIARVVGLPDVTFTATGISLTPASVVAVSQLDLGTFAVNTLATPVPVVRVVDVNGNPVSGAVVTFTADAGQGSILTGATVTTGADGLATLGSWNVGPTAGVTNRVRAFVAGLNQNGNEPAFIARTAAGTATTMVVAATSIAVQAAAANTPVTILPAVRVTDANGNPIVGTLVQFVPGLNGGTASNTVVLTDVNGVATVGSWTMPAGSGARVMTAILGSNTAITVTFTANVP